MLPVLALSLLVGPAGPLAYFGLVRPLFGKSAVTPKGGKPAGAKKEAAAPAAAQPASKKAQPSEKANGAAPPPAAEAKQPAQKPAQRPPQKNGKKGSAALAAAAAAVAASEAAPKGKGSNGAAKAAAKPAAAPKPAPALDIEDDRAFAEAAAALLRSRCVFCGRRELLPQGRCGRHLPPVRGPTGAGSCTVFRCVFGAGGWVAGQRMPACVHGRESKAAHRALLCLTATVRCCLHAGRLPRSDPGGA